MSSNVYCPLCGIILLSDPHRGGSPSLQAQPRLWHAEVRGIYPTGTPCSISLTGLGIIRCRNVLYAPLESHESYLGVEIDALEEWGICELSNRPWCFAFHDSCWKVLLLRLGHNDASSLQVDTAILRPLFYQLYSTPCSRASAFQFGHDYGGAAETHKTFGRIKPIDLGSPFYADPFGIPSISELEANTTGFLSSKANVNLPTKDTAYASALFQSNEVPALFRSLEDTSNMIRANPQEPYAYVFDKLSAELRSEIFSYLSLTELLNLRLVCRGLALLATSSAFSQSYWRSRFCIGQEADFPFPRLTEPRNWARLFWGIDISFRNRSLHLISRKRVRKLLEPIAALWELEAVIRSGPRGSIFSPTHNGESLQCFDSTTSETLVSIKLDHCFSGRLPSVHTDGPLEEGCRVVFHRAQSLRPSRQRIGISTIQLGTRSFISGINLSDSPGCTVGYRIPSSEKWVEMPPTSELRAIHVAFRSEGLTGVRFIFQDSRSSDWVGDTRSSGIAFGALSIPENGSEWPDLLAGLDYFKIVSLGLSEIPKSPSNDVIDPFGMQSALWAPHPPSENDLKFSPLLPLSDSSRAFDPLMNIDFGGPKGVRLGLLTRLTFHMTAHPMPLVGIEIFYSDGNSSLYGTRGGCELSFFIDGPKGECIDHIDILEESSQNHPGKILGGLQISTNFGRSASFAPLRSLIEKSVQPLPVFPSNNIITGFVAVNEGFHNRFTRIGYQSQQSEERLGLSTGADIFDHDSHAVPSRQIRYDEKFAHYIESPRHDNYQTYATLLNVRKIQASRGIRGRSRSSDRITGLKIEYFDYPNPTVLGQWIEEAGSFEFSRGEKVQSLAIRLSPVGFSRACPALELGQVTAIHIETTYSRGVTFKSTQGESAEESSIRPQRLLDHFHGDPDSGEDIVALSWILNSCYDRVRAVVSLINANGPTVVLVPEQPPPFDQTQKLYFTRYNRDVCDRETVVAAEAFFRDQEITGIVFIYPSGKKTKIGSFDDTAFQQTIHFPLDSQFIGVSIAGTEREIRKIEFELESNEQPALRRLSLPSQPLLGSGDPVPGERHWRDVWFQPDLSEEIHHRHSTPSVYDRIHAPPTESRLVGIALGCQNMSRATGLYETTPPL